MTKFDRPAAIDPTSLSLVWVKHPHKNTIIFKTQVDNEQVIQIGHSSYYGMLAQIQIRCVCVCVCVCVQVLVRLAGRSTVPEQGHQQPRCYAPGWPASLGRDGSSTRTDVI